MADKHTLSPHEEARAAKTPRLTLTEPETSQDGQKFSVKEFDLPALPAPNEKMKKRNMHTPMTPHYHPDREIAKRAIQDTAKWVADNLGYVIVGDQESRLESMKKDLESFVEGLNAVAFAGPVALVGAPGSGKSTTVDNMLETNIAQYTSESVGRGSYVGMHYKPAQDLPSKYMLDVEMKSQTEMRAVVDRRSISMFAEGASEANPNGDADAKLAEQIELGCDRKSATECISNMLVHVAEYSSAGSVNKLFCDKNRTWVPAAEDSSTTQALQVAFRKLVWSKVKEVLPKSLVFTDPEVRYVAASMEYSSEEELKSGIYRYARYAPDTGEPVYSLWPMVHKVTLRYESQRPEQIGVDVLDLPGIPDIDKIVTSSTMTSIASASMILLFYDANEVGRWSKEFIVLIGRVINCGQHNIVVVLSKTDELPSIDRVNCDILAEQNPELGKKLLQIEEEREDLKQEQRRINSLSEKQNLHKHMESGEHDNDEYEDDDEDQNQTQESIYEAAGVDWDAIEKEINVSTLELYRKERSFEPREQEVRTEAHLFSLNRDLSRDLADFGITPQKALRFVGVNNTAYKEATVSGASLRKTLLPLTGIPQLRRIVVANATSSSLRQLRDGMEELRIKFDRISTYLGATDERNSAALQNEQDLAVQVKAATVYLETYVTPMLANLEVWGDGEV